MLSIPAAANCSFFLEPIPFNVEISSLSPYLITSLIVSDDGNVSLDDHAVHTACYSPYLYVYHSRFPESEHLENILDSFKHLVCSVGNVFSVFNNYVQFDGYLILFSETSTASK